MKSIFRIFLMMLATMMFGFTMLSCDGGGGTGDGDSEEADGPDFPPAPPVPGWGGGGNRPRPPAADPVDPYADFNFDIQNGVLLGFSSTPTDLNIIIPANVSEIAREALQPFITGFYIESLRFSEPSQLQTIGEWSFTGNPALTGTIVIPASVRSIGGGAFSNTGITGLSFAPGSQLESIANNAFGGVTSLTGDIVIPPDVTSIGVAAFAGTTNVASITIPPSVTTMAPGVFTGWIASQRIYIPHDTLEPSGDSWAWNTQWRAGLSVPVEQVWNSLTDPPTQLAP